MRISRIFLSCFGCVAVVAALALYVSPPVTSADYQLAAAVDRYQVPDLSLPIAYLEQAVVVEEQARIDVPADAHLAAYTIANQPHSPWRFAAEAYSRIDPNRPQV